MTPLVALVVLWLFKTFTLVQRWPLGFLLIRVQMIPKFQGATNIEHMRPIAILSVWYRLWSRYQLWSLDPALVQSLPRGLVGGIPGRTTAGYLSSLMLRLERVMVQCVEDEEDEEQVDDLATHSEQDLSPQVECMLSLDAAKCFDAIRQADILIALTKLGVPAHVTTMLGVLYQGSCRFFSMAGCIDPHGFIAERGIPQGDPWSVLGTNALEVEWLNAVQGTINVQPIQQHDTLSPLMHRSAHDNHDTVEGHAMMDDRCLLYTSPSPRDRG
eukprot:5713401-Amphidinium_carterae.1